MRNELSSKLTPLWWAVPIVWSVGVAIGLSGQWIGWFSNGSTSISTDKLFIESFAIALLTIFSFWLCFPLKRVGLVGSEVHISGILRTFKFLVTDIVSVNGPDWSSLNRITLQIAAGPSHTREFLFTPKLGEAKEVKRYLERRMTSL